MDSEGGQAAHLILELPDISRPVIPGQQLNDTFGELRRALQLIVAGEEQPGEGRYVLPAFPQRRDIKLQPLDPVVEILTKGALPHQALEVRPGGRDHPDINLQGSLAPQRTYLAILQHTQQACLHIDAHILDIVEKEGASIRLG